MKMKLMFSMLLFLFGINDSLIFSMEKKATAPVASEADRATAPVGSEPGPATAPPPYEDVGRRQYSKDELCQIAEKYLYGDGVEKDQSKAAEYFQQAVDKGNIDAMVRLAILLQRGTDVKRDRVRSARLLYDAARAENAEGQFQLGLVSRRGMGVMINDAYAYSWFHRAAQQGHPYAKLWKGICLDNGNGVAKNHEMAQRLFNESFPCIKENGRKKDADPEELLALGYCYEFGLGTSKDYEDAFKCYLKGAMEHKFAPAQCKVAQCYVHGKGTVTNPQEAVKYYRLAVSQNYALAQNNLGCLLREGKLVSPDQEEGKHLMQLAADQGLQKATSNLSGPPAGVLWAVARIVIGDLLRS